MHVMLGKPISQNGLGLKRLTTPYYQMPDEATFKLLRTAINEGYYLWSGADYYGSPEANSLHLMKRYFTAYPEDTEKVVLTIKTGLFGPAETTKIDGSPAFLRQAASTANAILGGKKTIDVFGPGRVDPKVPIEESVQALAELKREGKIGGILLSEVRAETIHRASAVCKIDVVEAEASIWSPMVFDNGVAEACAELGIVLVANSPLGMGALTGEMKSLDDLKVDDPVRSLPRFQPDVSAQNARFVGVIEMLARAKGCSTAQFAISWLKRKSRKLGMPVIVPVPGIRSMERLRENTANFVLSDEEYARVALIQRELPVAGLRTMAALAELNEY